VTDEELGRMVEALRLGMEEVCEAYGTAVEKSDS